MTDSRPSGLGLHFFLGGMLLLGLCAAAVFAPFWPCPSCEIMVGKRVPAVRAVYPNCVACGGKGRLSLHHRWQEVQALRSNNIPNVPLFP